MVRLFKITNSSNQKREYYNFLLGLLDQGFKPVFSHIPGLAILKIQTILFRLFE